MNCWDCHKYHKKDRWDKCKMKGSQSLMGCSTDDEIRAVEIKL
jgi:hypothetical protein